LEVGGYMKDAAIWWMKRCPGLPDFESIGVNVRNDDKIFSKKNKSRVRTKRCRKGLIEQRGREGISKSKIIGLDHDELDKPFSAPHHANYAQRRDH
jgi:hypothetical protein